MLYDVCHNLQCTAVGFFSKKPHSHPVLKDYKGEKSEQPINNAALMIFVGHHSEKKEPSSSDSIESICKPLSQSCSCWWWKLVHSLRIMTQERCQEDITCAVRDFLWI